MTKKQDIFKQSVFTAKISFYELKKKNQTKSKFLL